MNQVKPMMKDRLQKEFVVPPFSILDTRQKNWQERRDSWLSLGIKSEVGRNDKLLGTSAIDGSWQRRVLNENSKGLGASFQGISIFNPVLCEIMYKWFCPKEGKILDPFAGGSVRGIVAEFLGYHYTGIELRQEQIDSNIEQAKNIGVNPTWIHGDSNNIEKLVSDKYDFLFSCPPYYDLELYSNLSGELSNMGTYQDFLESYRSIIAKSVDLLKDNSFACFVVSEIRDKQNENYRGFVKDTVDAFNRCKMKYYNEMILINSIGSLPIRTKTFFVPKRKVGRHHQNVLVFYKGDISQIKPIESEYKVESIDKWL